MNQQNKHTNSLGKLYMGLHSWTIVNVVVITTIVVDIAGIAIFRIWAILVKASKVLLKVWNSEKQTEHTNKFHFLGQARPFKHPTFSKIYTESSQFVEALICE